MRCPSAGVEVSYAPAGLPSDLEETAVKSSRSVRRVVENSFVLEKICEEKRNAGNWSEEEGGRKEGEEEEDCRAGM